MFNLDTWINNICREIEKELKEEMTKEYKEAVVIYASMYYEAVHREWDNYLNSYEPVAYMRTGNTSAGIVLDDRPNIKLDGTIEASVQFEDSYMIDYEVIQGKKRHIFLAMNDGWNIPAKGRRKANFHQFGGLDILERVEAEIKRLLPPEIKLEVIRRDRR